MWKYFEQFNENSKTKTLNIGHMQLPENLYKQLCLGIYVATLVLAR